MEGGSSHPPAQAIVREAADLCIPVAAAQGAKPLMGKAASAVVGDAPSGSHRSNMPWAKARWMGRVCRMPLRW